MRSKQELLTYGAPFYLRIESSVREKRCGTNQKKIREFRTVSYFTLQILSASPLAQGAAETNPQNICYSNRL